jgi:hypothetical protein
MITQRDMQAAYEYGVKLAYEHLQKSANADAMGRPLESWESGVSGGAPQSTRLPPDAFPSPQMPAAEKGLSQMTAEEVMQGLKNRGSGFLDELKGLRSTLGIPNAPQMSEIASRSYGAANNVADRFLSHMGRHPAAYGLGAAGLGAAGLTGLGLGIGNTVHNSRD